MTQAQRQAINDYLNCGSNPWTSYPANGCVGVNYGRISCYFFFEGDSITRVIFD